MADENMAKKSVPARGTRVAGKKVFITGAGQGLGATFAKMLAAEGASVTLSDVTAEAAEAQAEKINGKFPGTAHAVALDVTQVTQWQSALREAETKMGGISVLINNAGIGTWGNIETETSEGWQRVHDINLNGVFTGTQAAMPYLKMSQPASIITISSIASMLADANSLAYNSSKAGVAHFARSVAMHCARERYDIRSNSVHPVFTRTNIIDPLIAMGGGGETGEKKLVRNIPLRRLGEPEDVGYAVIYLASDESRFVTGTELRIDGGMTAGLA
ncbi:MAG: SDR family oxidoreductase [Pseudomonadota bacterium]